MDWTSSDWYWGIVGSLGTLYLVIRIMWFVSDWMDHKRNQWLREAIQIRQAVPYEYRKKVRT